MIKTYTDKILNIIDGIESGETPAGDGFDSIVAVCDNARPVVSLVEENERLRDDLAKALQKIEEFEAGNVQESVRVAD